MTNLQLLIDITKEKRLTFEFEQERSHILHIIGTFPYFLTQ